MSNGEIGKTAFVLAGGSSLGAVQVGMLKALTEAGVTPDLIVGASVGAINCAYFAAYPNDEGIRGLTSIWSGLKSRDIFPFSPLKSILRIFLRQDHLLESGGLRRFLGANLPFRMLEETAIPCHVVATDILGGEEVVFSRGPAVDALVASAAIPAVFPPVQLGDRLLVDGGVANNTPISTAVKLGATRVIALPTGFACALDVPPRSAVGIALHSLSLITARQMTNDLEHLAARAELITVPPLCPVSVSPYDLSHSLELIEQAADATRAWIEFGGLERPEIAPALYPHHHGE